MVAPQRAQRSHVLLGYDGTGDAALRWAVEETRLRGLDLTICHCWHWPYPEGHEDPRVKAALQRAGENLLRQGVRQAGDLGAPGKVHGLLRRGPVSDTLVRESGDAELIVVGSHERRQVPAGSTAVRLPACTHRPVVVVRRYGRPRGLVVVGVDGSESADAALGFAIEEAALRESDLRVVYAAWEPGVVPDWELPLFTDRKKLYRARAAELDELVRPWTERYPKVPVEVSLLLERPREVLLDAADGADLLVVGDRGVAGVDPLLLGATSSAMLHHAPCTVAVVPPRDAAPRAA
ncbi:nucleotide-binding universal stress UspA family protein [Actinomadura pelletieri DSM 43383]|uniref:Nucleotide-binding universal stress UspA family protein n=1 Tax=Actinomadura pelletieri DSM 43383 TaxID=1120940 RepID=A0A495QGI3_9ACTN|nr:universal stress protein [Actinomadura pelletieri]RKS71017.1 nucleotide-binding universal stress UspA family protein [Actinomadura pelletieri DSM 43383]